MCLNLDQYFRKSGCKYVSYHTRLMVACISYLSFVAQVPDCSVVCGLKVNLTADAVLLCCVLQLLTWREPGRQVHQVRCIQKYHVVSPCMLVQLHNRSYALFVVWCKLKCTYLAVMMKLDKPVVSIPLKHRQKCDYASGFNKQICSICWDTQILQEKYIIILRYTI